MEPLRIRVIDFADDEGVKFSHIANECDIEAIKLYNLRSGAQKTLNERDAIALHEYLKQRGY